MPAGSGSAPGGNSESAIDCAGAGGLLGGFGIGHGITAVLYGMRSGGDLRRIPAVGRLGDRLRRVAKRYRRFPAYAAPSTLVGALATRLPYLLLLYFFDTRTDTLRQHRELGRQCLPVRKASRGKPTATGCGVEAAK